jgi:polyhydroxybutyrate depolymerase
VHSPALAIGWEFRQRHRFALIALAGYALAFAALRLLILGPEQAFTLDPPNGTAGAVIAPVSVAFMYLLAVFSFGLAGDIAARQSMFPARMFTLPVTTRALAGWPMLFGTATMASLWLVTATLVRWSWGVELPLIWPALLGAVFLAWTQVLTWMPYGLPGLRVVAAVLWLAALDAVVILALHYEVPEQRLVAMLAPQLPLAYLAACFVVARARRGEVPDWRGVFARIGRIARVPSFRQDRFPSPTRAQVWFEWRQHGRLLPALVACVLPFELGLLSLARHEPPVLVWLTLLAVLLTPPFMAGFTATAGKSASEGSLANGLTFLATRPLTSAAIVAAKLRVAVGSTLAAWLLVLLAIPTALVLTDTWPLVVERAEGLVESFGKPRALAIALLGFSGLLASTWKQLVQGLFIGLTGRAWVIRTSVLLRLSSLVVLGFVADWGLRKNRLLVVLWDHWPWILAALVGFKMAAAAWIVPRLHRSGLVSDRALLTGAALWLAAVLAIHGVLVWLFCTPEFIPRALAGLVAILSVPLVRVSAAPLALAWNRHRGTRRDPAPVLGAPPRDARVLRAVGLALSVPLVLLVVESVSFEIRNRSNATIVSSGEEREYLLHVPKSYDPARPTALVISLHGGAIWPAAQRDTSLWNRVADQEGFIVVYPSGTTGDGPRHWNANRGPGLAKDVRFIADLIDSLRASYNIDPARIYADGLSNGGGMAFVLSCRLSDRIAAVGLVASAQFLPFDWCTNERAVPMISFHGTADRSVPYHGGKSLVAAEHSFPAVPTWTADWARRNRCAPEPAETVVAADVTRLEYSGCAGDAGVVLYTVKGGGHSWPGGGLLPEWFVGHTSYGVDASREMWEFFRDHPLR